MIYREYGKTGKQVSVLGLGTLRWGKEDEALAIETVQKALEYGVNYIDVAPNYAGGQAEVFVGKAIAGAKQPIYLSSKSSSTADPTAVDLRKRLEQSLRNLNIDHIVFYHMWTVMGWEHYLDIMRPGGPYEGALRAKEEGLIGHICFSSHCDENTTLRIIEEATFEGVIVSLNALNYSASGGMKAILDKASSLGMGVATMNTLAGGLIPKNPTLFQHLLGTDVDVTTQCLRFNAALPGVSVVLSGMKTPQEVQENCHALEAEKDLGSASFTAEQRTGLCTGCGYCLSFGPCPAGIPIPQYMQAYNYQQFPDFEYSGRPLTLTDPQRIEADKIFRPLRNQYGITLHSPENPCIKCGACEKRCTQKLPIIDRIQRMYKLAEGAQYSIQAIKKRLENIFSKAHGQIIGLTPTGNLTEMFLDVIKIHMPEYESQLRVFDVSEKTWGSYLHGVPVCSPAEILSLGTKVLLIPHYWLQDRIYEEYAPLRESGVHVEKLYRSDDIPWVG